MRRTTLALLLTAMAVAITACVRHIQLNAAGHRQHYRTANADLRNGGPSAQRYLKAHMRDGDVHIFGPGWKIDTAQRSIQGAANRYDAARRPIGSGPSVVGLDSVVLLETNHPLEGKDGTYAAGITVISVINAIGIGLCAINPKACFGSCPTFYLPGDQHWREARAEGFSNAIHPRAQYADRDHLGLAEGSGNEQEVIMKNEALETHVIDRLWLEAFPVLPGEDVRMDSKERFFRCGRTLPCITALHNGEDAQASLRCEDGIEWWSAADSHDLRGRSTLELTFRSDPAMKAPGIVINFRQTLLTTFLLYTALGYMGHDVSDHLARLQCDETMLRRTSSTLMPLQDIIVEVRMNGRWLPVDTLHETGPIARNRVVVPLPLEATRSSHIAVRLTSTAGMYRFDHVGLTEVNGPAQGVLLRPQGVTDHAGCPLPERSALLERDQYKLISYPGEVRRITFGALPEGEHRWQLFIGSDGYYLEWMRPEWLRNTDPGRLRAMLLGNETEWRALAREYKAMERSMDEVFWNSQQPTPAL